MKHVIAGTAGHIDHGKTALVKALTGIDADRLAEEKRRGITIDLGFAHLQLTPSLTVGFVDVPGHERFIKNMLAGVGGIDIVLFTVAADESIKPQTREHFDICRLLGISRGLIAITKADLVDGDILALVRMEIEDLVKESFLDGAPMVPVSAVTGAGLDELRKELIRAGEAAPPRNASGHFRLPVDRVFSVKGFGTVATGTLISGSVAKEQEVELYPAGLRLRVRGIETHGEQADRAAAGQRTAVNLAGIEPSQMARGDVLSEPGRFRAVRRIDCRLDLLPSAKPLKHRAPVHFHAGTAEIEAEARLLEGTPPLQPGASAWVRIVLREPALLLPGDRFIIRMFSPVVTIGGGVVVDVGETAKPSPALLKELASADPVARVRALLGQAPYGFSMEQLVARTGLTSEELARAGRAADPPAVTYGQPPWYIDASHFDSLRARLAEAVRNFHLNNPLLAGMPREDLRNRELPGAPPDLLSSVLAHAAELVPEGEIVRTRGHSVLLKEDEERAREAIESAFERAGLAVPALADVLAGSGLEPSRARSIFAILLREKRLVRIAADLVFHHSAIDQLRTALALRKGSRFGVGEFKEWTGVSRKYAIPLLEYMDRERVTRREGDQRVIL